MKFDGFFDESEHFIAGFSHGNAAGQIGHMRPKARGTLFHDDQVSHSYPFRPACLSMFYRVPGGMSMLGFTGNGYQARLGWVLELPVTTPHAHLNPTIAFEQPDNLGLHAQGLHAIDPGSGWST
jgi:hypothetical protein